MPNNCVRCHVYAMFLSPETVQWLHRPRLRDPTGHAAAGDSRETELGADPGPQQGQRPRGQGEGVGGGVGGVAEGRRPTAGAEREAPARHPRGGSLAGLYAG